MLDFALARTGRPVLIQAQTVRLLAFGFTACFFSAFGQTFYIALFNPHWRAAFELSNAGVGAIYSAATLLSGFAIIHAGQLIDRVPLARFVTVSVLVFALGCVLLAATPAAWMLLPAIFLVRFCGQGLMTHVALSSMARFFERARGRAIGTATLGFPAGEAIFPITVVAAIAALGWRGVWWITAVGLVLLVLPLMLWLPGGTRRRPPETVSSAGASRGEVLRDTRFYRVLPVLLAAPFIITGLFFHQAALAAAQGWPLAVLAAAFIGFALTQVASALLTGWLIDRLGARNLLRFFLLPIGLGASLLYFGEARWVAFVYMALAGLSAGANSSLGGALWAELYGTRHIGAIRSMHTSLMVFSTALSPVLLGVLLDAGAGMPTLALAMGLCALAVGPLLGGAARRPPPAGMATG